MLNGLALRNGFEAAPNVRKNRSEWQRDIGDCRQYTEPASRLVETSTLRGMCGMLRLRWLRSRTMFEVPYARMSPQNSEGCLRRYECGSARDHLNVESL
jgi:hypothetical protein